MKKSKETAATNGRGSKLMIVGAVILALAAIIGTVLEVRKDNANVPESTEIRQLLLKKQEFVLADSLFKTKFFEFVKSESPADSDYHEIVASRDVAKEAKDRYEVEWQKIYDKGIDIERILPKDIELDSIYSSVRLKRKFSLNPSQP